MFRPCLEIAGVLVERLLTAFVCGFTFHQPSSCAGIINVHDDWIFI